MKFFKWSIYLSSAYYPFNQILVNKVFEYIQSGLPIISIGAECIVSRFIGKESIGFHINVKNKTSKEIKKIFKNKLKEYQKYKSNILKICSSNNYRINYERFANLLSDNQLL